MSAQAAFDTVRCRTVRLHGWRHAWRCAIFSPGAAANRRPPPLSGGILVDDHLWRITCISAVAFLEPCSSLPSSSTSCVEPEGTLVRPGIYGVAQREFRHEHSTVPNGRAEIEMRLTLRYALLASALLCLSACNRAESPENVQADVATAQSNAVEENAKADERVKQVDAEAAKDRTDALNKVADKSVGAIADSAVTQAEGETNVALAKCQALEGDAQKTCEDEANAHLDAVRAKAKAAKSG